MKSIVLGVLISIASANFLLANKASKKLSCKTGAYSQDTDPAGTNIRSEPNGKIVAQIPDETIFSVFGYENDWFEASNFAYFLDSEREIEFAKRHGHKIEGERAVIPGLKGWIHRKHVTFHFGGRYDAKLFAAPNEDSKIILPIGGREAESPLSVLSCSDKWFKIRFKGQIGWVNSICLNTRSNCS